MGNDCRLVKGCDCKGIKRLVLDVRPLEKAIKEPAKDPTKWCFGPVDPEGILTGRYQKADPRFPQYYDPSKPDALKPSEMPDEYGLEQAWHVIESDLDLEGIAKQYNFSTWEKLAKYNWGTDVAAEINWCLHKYCKHLIARTKLKEDPHYANYYYVKPPTIPVGGQPKGVWVAKVKNRPKQVVPLHKGGSNVKDNKVCQYRTANKCDRVEPSTSGPPVCRSPWDTDIDPRFIIPEAPEEGVKKYVQKQSVDQYVLTMIRWRIHRVKPGTQEKLESFEHLTTFDVFYDAESTVREDWRRTGSVKPSASRSVHGISAVKDIDGHRLRGREGREQLEIVATSIRDLQDAGLLKRLVIRGYIDREKRKGKEERAAISKRRARWVFDVFRNEFMLPLIDEKDKGGAGSVGETYQHRLKSGYTPVEIVGCGAGDSQPGRVSNESRCVIVDFEKKSKPEREEIEPGKEKAKAEQLFYRWTYYEHELDGTYRSMLHSQLSGGLAFSAYSVFKYQEEAIAHLQLIGSMHGDTNASAVKHMESVIRSWNNDKTQEIKDMMTGAPPRLGPLSTSYFHEFTRVVKTPGGGRQSRTVVEAVVGPYTGYDIPFLKLGGKDNPTHYQVEEWASSVAVGADVARQAPVVSAGPYVMPVRRINFM
jgi:hypothetical protein